MPFNRTGASAGTTATARVPTRAGGGAWRVKASAESYGGLGSCGYGIQGHGYSELSTVPMGDASDFKALGDIPCGTVLKITNPGNGKTTHARKQDVGSGSPGFLPVMGLYPLTVTELGLTGGEFNVIIERIDGGKLAPVRGTPAGAGTGSSTDKTGAATPTNASDSGGDSLLDILKDLVTGNIGDLAAALAMATAAGIKDMAVGFADLVIVPVWHRNQEAVWYYTDTILFPGKSSSYKAWQTWPANAAFWGFGYGLLFTDPTTGSLKPVPPRQSRIARHIRGTQGLPARQSLVKPSKVLEKTPKKPVAKTSGVGIRPVGSLNTHRRNRPVTITGLTNGLNDGSSDNGRQPGRPTRTRAAVAPVVSETNIREVREIKAPRESDSAKSKPSHAKSYPNYPGRLRSRTDSRNGSSPPTDKRTGKRDHSRHRPIPRN